MMKWIGIFGVLAGTASAEGLTVVTDIAPVQSLVSGIVGEHGSVAALLPPGASPHDFSLRPSDAAGLSEADVVIWIGEGLTPWLVRPIENLAVNADVTSLVSLPSWPKRELEEDHDDHDHGHDHGKIDPHGWLDPAIAALWSIEIGEIFAKTDPERAAAYRERAQAQSDALMTLSDEVAATLKDVGPFILSHDGYGYFEAQFGLSHAGVVSDSDEVAAGPVQLGLLRDAVEKGEIACLFYEVGPTPRWVDTLGTGHDLYVGTLDPLGASLPSGAALYPTLIREMAASFAQCTPDAAGS